MPLGRVPEVVRTCRLLLALGIGIVLVGYTEWRRAPAWSAPRVLASALGTDDLAGVLMIVVG